MHALYKLLLFHVLACLGQNALAGYIINGVEAPRNAMQYMVSLQNMKGHHLCGGFLVTEDFVVSAAHCDHRELKRVVLGTHNLKVVDNEKIRYIEGRFKPPFYESPGLGKDIMLFKLSEKAQLSNSIQTIPLPTSGMSIRNNDECSVAGWGSNISRGPAVDALRVVNVSIIEPQVCNKEWPNLPDDVICAGGYQTKKGFCQGDSGGPLVCNGTAVGIVSFNQNYNCAYPDKPNVYTDVTKYLPWINNITKQCE